MSTEADQKRTITVVYEKGNEVVSLDLVGKKVGVVFDTPNGIVRAYADAMTVLMPIGRLVMVIQPG